MRYPTKANSRHGKKMSRNRSVIVNNQFWPENNNNQYEVYSMIRYIQWSVYQIMIESHRDCCHHNYDTRNRDQIHIDRTRTRYADKRVRIYLPTVLNLTPTPLLEKIATHSLQGFALNLKKYFIHQYSDICSIPNCYICRHNLTWLVIVATCVTFPCLFFFVCLLFVCLFVFLKPSGNGGFLMYLMYHLVASTVAATKP